MKEPESELIGYTKAVNDDSKYKVIKLNELFIDKDAPLDDLIGICCDGDPANTNARNGIIRRFELQLKRPLYWFVCLLHITESACRQLFDALEQSPISGHRPLSKQIETCEYRVCNC